jgi:hypothetical protein
MPLTSKGEKIHRAMVEKHGKEEGERIFYASKNAGRITGVDKKADAEEKEEKKDAEVKETPTKETKTTVKEPAGEEKEDPKSKVKSAEMELKALEREQEQSEESQSRQNNIDDQKSIVRQLRNEMRETEHKERMGIADATEKVEYQQDRAVLLDAISKACDNLSERMDAFAARRSA